MSYLIAKVMSIQNCDSLHHVTFDCEGHILGMMGLELPKGIDVGKKVKLVIKATHVTLAKEFTGLLSYTNKLPVMIDSINNGTLLSSITLKFSGAFPQTYIESIIPRTASETMSLKVGDKISALIKASEIAICEVMDD